MIPSQGLEAATATGSALYVAYNVAATVVSFPVGHLSDRLGARGPLVVILGGVAAFLVSYLVFAFSPAQVVILGAAFVLAGIEIGCAETAHTAAVAAVAALAPRAGS